MITYITPSDKKIGPHVWASYHTMYRSRKSRRAARDAANLIECALPYFRELLDFSKTVKVRIAGIKGRVNGRFSNDQELVMLDNQLIFNPYRTGAAPYRMIEVLAHELVHAEQYHQGRLANTLGKRGWMHQWNGEVNTNRGSTYRAYRNQPWEIEAFSRQGDLAAKICTKLGIAVPLDVLVGKSD